MGLTGHGFGLLCELRNCLRGNCHHFFLSELLPSSRKTQDLPARAFSLTPAERLRIFVHAIFYVGKGTRARPDVHLWEALRLRRQPGKQVGLRIRVMAGATWPWGGEGRRGLEGRPLTPPWSPRPAPKCTRSWTFGPVVVAWSPCIASNTWLLWRLILERRVLWML